MDVDHLIEELHGAPIRRIVESRGWDYFRAEEKRVTQGIFRGDHLIIAPGGGAVLDPENVRAMKQNGRLIWLKARPEVLTERMERDPRTPGSRPSLTGKKAMEEIGEVLAARNPHYEGAADLKIETSDLDVEGVVEKILALLGEKKEN